MRAEIGLRQQRDRLATLQRPVDAILLGSEIVALEAYPPWVRIFDRDGNFISALASARGDSSDLLRPFALGAGLHGTFLVSDIRGIRTYARDGSVRATTMRPPGLRLRGALQTCDGHTLILAAKPGSQEPGMLGSYRTDDRHVDTVTVLDTLRAHSQAYHPAFLARSGNHALVYTDERDRPRIVELGCDGAMVRELTLAPLGRDETEIVQGTKIRFTPPTFPLPAGVAAVNGRVLWATQVRVASANSDSLFTIVTAIDSDGVGRRIALPAHLQIVDGDSTGTLLLLRGARRTRLSLISMDGNRLIRVIDSAGTSEQRPVIAAKKQPLTSAAASRQ
jgi:hypothetical protein